MSNNNYLADLRDQQETLLNVVSSIGEANINRQFHPELSPLGWHLGHCVYTESFWIRETVLQQAALDETLTQLYIPELSIKAERSGSLPNPGDLVDWALSCQAENLDLLSGLEASNNPHELMQDNYLAFFLCQHYAQHIETACYVKTQAQLQDGNNYEAQGELKAASLDPGFVKPAKTTTRIGESNPLRHYDNECGQFDIELEEFEIASRPVSNAEYLQFIVDGGYEREELWNEKAWSWRKKNQLEVPQHWLRDSNGNIYGVGADGPHELPSDGPVTGVSWHEARAFARWADARLPHEYEWELAKRQSLLNGVGELWEWCNNELHPYPGFVAFPYDGYSLPWFDGTHFALRGHSQYTQDIIKRDSFRNFYQADKRHFPAGLRLAR